MEKNKKKCARCKHVKHINEFSFKNKERGLRQSYCKTCMRNIQREHYKKHKARYRRKSKKRRDEVSAILNDMKDQPCADCGQVYPYYIMDFDHRDEEDKHFNIGTRKYSVSLEKLLEEVEKCDVVCSNCHRARTFRRENGIPLSSNG